MTKLNLHELSYEEDFKAALIKALGDLSFLSFTDKHCLVAVKPDRARTKSGLIMPDKTLSEVRYQGKVGLLVAMGPTAFKYDFDNPSLKFEGTKPKIHDWVVYMPHESREIAIKGTVCRIIMDRAIHGTTTDPEAIY